MVLGLCSGLLFHTAAVALGLAALLAACFSLPGGVLRAFGGILSDKYGAHSVTWWVMWVSWICLFLLSYPQTDFTIATVAAPTVQTEEEVRPTAAAEAAPAERKAVPAAPGGAAAPKAAAPAAKAPAKK